MRRLRILCDLYNGAGKDVAHADGLWPLGGQRDIARSNSQANLRSNSNIAGRHGNGLAMMIQVRDAELLIMSGYLGRKQHSCLEPARLGLEIEALEQILHRSFGDLHS